MEFVSVVLPHNYRYVSSAVLVECICTSATRIWSPFVRVQPISDHHLYVCSTCLITICTCATRVCSPFVCVKHVSDHHLYVCNTCLITICMSATHVWSPFVRVQHMSDHHLYVCNTCLITIHRKCNFHRCQYTTHVKLLLKWELHVPVVFSLLHSVDALYRENSFLYLLHEYRTEKFLYLGTFAKFWKATISSVTSVCPHGTTPLSLGGFWWTLVFRLFSKICRENSNFIKIWQEWRVLYMKTFSHLWRFSLNYFQNEKCFRQTF
jgi:hypothetical protein